MLVGLVGLRKIRWSRATYGTRHEHDNKWQNFFRASGHPTQVTTPFSYKTNDTMKSPSLLVSILATIFLCPSHVLGSSILTEDESSKPPPFPTACVKFAVFDNPHCDGDPRKIVKYPTYKNAGQSPCLADPVHPWASLGDQYCDLERQNYHFEFYPLSGKCEGDPVKLNIPTDGGCKWGIKVYHCKQKLCLPEGENEEWMQDEEVLELLQQNYYELEFLVEQ